MHRVAEDVVLEFLLVGKLGKKDDLHAPVELLGRSLLASPQGADVGAPVELATGLQLQEPGREVGQVGGARELECDWVLAGREAWNMERACVVVGFHGSPHSLFQCRLGYMLLGWRWAGDVRRVER